MPRFLALVALLFGCSLPALGEDVAHAAAAVVQVASATPRGLKVQKGMRPGIDVIRDFLDQAKEAKVKRAEEGMGGAQLDYCVINSWVAFNYLTQAFLEIDATADDCKDVVDANGATKRTCAADIFGILQCFFSTGGYVAGLVTQCSALQSAHAQCASAIVAWMGSLTETFQAVLSMPQTCGELHPKPPAVAGSPEEPQQRQLGTGHSKAHNVVIKKGAPAAWCYLQINSALAYLAQAGVNMGAAARNCADQSTAEKRGACSTDINGLLSSISDIVSFVGGAASLCAGSINNAGLCAGDVGTLGNALFGLAASSSAFKWVCKMDDFNPDFDAAARRLTETTATNHSVLPDGLRTVIRRLSDRFDIPAPDMNFI